MPFILFSSYDSMTKSAKEKLAIKLSETEKPESCMEDRPVFPVINAATVLIHLVGPGATYYITTCRNLHSTEIFIIMPIRKFSVMLTLLAIYKNVVWFISLSLGLAAFIFFQTI